MSSSDPQRVEDAGLEHTQTDHSVPEGEGAAADAVSAPPSGGATSRRVPGQLADAAPADEATVVPPAAESVPSEPLASEPAAAEPAPSEPAPSARVSPEPVSPEAPTADPVVPSSADPSTADPATPATDAIPGQDPATGPAAGTEAPPAEATPTDAAVEQAPPAPVETTGHFEAYTIGNPGRAFSQTVSLTETKYRDAHDIVIDAATIPDPEGTHRLVLRGASSRGLAHQQYGDPRQDDHCVVLSHDGEWLVCLVADGVSSGEWSHLAAKMATEEGATEIVRLLETHRPEEIPFREVFLRLSDLLADVCATLPDAEPTVDLTPKDVSRRMATTLVAGIVATRPSEDGTHEVTVVRLGDTSAWVLDAEDGWIALGEVKNAGNVIAESATACLPLVPETDPVPVRTTLGADAALVLMTDGVGDPLGSGTGEVGRELARQWVRPPHPVEFAAQIAFGRKTFDDDRGAVAVWLAVPE